MKNPVFSLLAGGRQRVKYEIASWNMGHYSVRIIITYKYFFCLSYFDQNVSARLNWYPRLNAAAFIKFLLAENHSYFQ